MTLEDRLRTTLREAAGSADASDWDRVVSRSVELRRARRRQQLAVVGLSAAAVVAAVLGVFLGSDRPERRDVTTEPGPGDRPAYVVTVEDERVVVRSSSDGRELRVLADGEDARGAHAVAVSPDGSTVYFTRGRPACDGARANDATAQIVRVPIGGGPTEEVGWGYFPAVRPDGGAIAYTSDPQHNGCGTSAEIVFKVFGTDEIFPVVRPNDLGYESLGVMGYSPDGSKLLLGALPPSDPVKLFVADVATRGARGVREIQLPRNAAPTESLARAAFISNDEIAMWFEDESRSGAVVVDVDTGEIGRTLFSYDRGAVVTDLHADPTGRHLLASIEAPVGYSLVRWDADDDVENLGDFRLRDIAWGRGPTEPPGHFVGVKRRANLRGELAVFDSRDGSLVRSLSKDVDLSFNTPRLSSSPDGRYVYMDTFALEDCADDPSRRRQKIARVDVATGEVGEAAVGTEPALSPDGYKLAYLESMDTCGVYDTLVVRYLQGGHEDRFRAGAGAEISAPRWSPDSRMMVVTHSGGDVSVRLVDTVEPDAQTIGEMTQVALPEFTAYYAFITQEEFVGVATPEDASDVLTFDHGGDIQRRFTRLSGTTSVVSAEPDPTGNHVLVVRALGAPRGEDAEMSLSDIAVGGLEPRSIAADDIVAAVWLQHLPAAQ